MIKDKPQDTVLNAEKAILGAALRENDVARELCAQINGDGLFTDARHRAIWCAIRARVQAGQPSELVTIDLGRSQPKLLEYLPELDAACHSATNWPYWLGEIKEANLRNTLLIDLKYAGEMIEEGHNPEAILKGIRGIAKTLQKSNWTSLVQEGTAVLAEDIPDPVEIVQFLITEQSKVVIGGGSKSYKTWLTLDLAVSLASGDCFMGRYQCKKCRVLYVNLELKDKTFKKRLQTICGKRNRISPGDFHHITLRGKIRTISPASFVDKILEVARECKVDVVIIDPVYKLNTQGDENSAGDQTKLFNELDRITTETDCTLILNDHFGKGNHAEKDPLDAIRGSSAKGGDVDAAIILRPHEQKNSYRVDIVHRELAPVEPFVITWSFPFFGMDSDLDPERMKLPKPPRKKKHSERDILKVLLDEPLSFREWARRSKISTGTMSDYAESFRKRRLIKTVEKNGRSLSSLTIEGEDFIKTPQVEPAQ
jgi:hypothetical protein